MRSDNEGDRQMPLLRSGSLDLDATDRRIGRIPAAYHADIRQMLRSGDIADMKTAVGLGLMDGCW